MPSVAVKPRVVPEVELLIVPVPRTSAVIEVWSEIAAGLDVPGSQINNILRKGLDNFLIGSAIIVFLNRDDEVLFDLEMKMDWEKHRLLVEYEPNIDLCPQQPFTEQLHSNFQRLLVYLRQAKATRPIARVELQIRFRPEIHAKPDLLARARQFLGVDAAPQRRYARGTKQPDMTFRFAPVPETTFVVREIWPD
jgi:hypothetical protein